MSIKINPPKAEKPKAKDLQKDGRRRSPTRRGYSVKVFEKLFQYIGEGMTLAEACAKPGMPTVWTARRRLAVDDVLKDRYDKVLSIKFHALVDELPELPNKALAGFTKVSPADMLTAAKQRADNIKWIASKILSEFAGDGEGAGSVVVNLVNSPDAAEPGAAPVQAIAQGPKLQIVGGKSDTGDGAA